MPRIKTMPAHRTLTDQQKYLLNRLPARYDIKEPKPEAEPTEVKQARRLVAEWDDRQRKLSCKQKCAAEKALTKAKEAIYFKPVAEALAAVQQAETLTRCCSD